MLLSQCNVEICKILQSVFLSSPLPQWCSKTHWSEYNRIFANCSCRSISFKIIPVFSATSSFSYPASPAKITSCLEERYSTVGHREPICRRSRLLNICTTSFRDSNSKRAIFWTRRYRRSVLYVSCASCATSSGAGSTNKPNIQGTGLKIQPKDTPPSPYSMALICCRFFEMSSFA